jgi:hypothetical protein
MTAWHFRMIVDSNDIVNRLKSSNIAGIDKLDLAQVSSILAECLDCAVLTRYDFFYTLERHARQGSGLAAQGLRTVDLLLESLSTASRLQVVAAVLGARFNRDVTGTPQQLQSAKDTFADCEQLLSMLLAVIESAGLSRGFSSESVLEDDSMTIDLDLLLGNLSKKKLIEMFGDFPREDLQEISQSVRYVRAYIVSIFEILQRNWQFLADNQTLILEVLASEEGFRQSTPLDPPDSDYALELEGTERLLALIKAELSALGRIIEPICHDLVLPGLADAVRDLLESAQPESDSEFDQGRLIAEKPDSRVQLAQVISLHLLGKLSELPSSSGPKEEPPQAALSRQLVAGLKLSSSALAERRSRDSLFGDPNPGAPPPFDQFEVRATQATDCLSDSVIVVHLHAHVVSWLKALMRGHDGALEGAGVSISVIEDAIREAQRQIEAAGQTCGLTRLSSDEILAIFSNSPTSPVDRYDSESLRLLGCTWERIGDLSINLGELRTGGFDAAQLAAVLETWDAELVRCDIEAAEALVAAAAQALNPVTEKLAAHLQGISEEQLAHIVNYLHLA